MSAWTGFTPPIVPVNGSRLCHGFAASIDTPSRTRRPSPEISGAVPPDRRRRWPLRHNGLRDPCAPTVSSRRIHLRAGVDSHVNESQGTGPSTIPLPRTRSTETERLWRDDGRDGRYGKRHVGHGSAGPARLDRACARHCSTGEIRLLPLKGKGTAVSECPAIEGRKGCQPLFRPR